MPLWLWAVVLFAAAVGALALAGWFLARTQDAESRALARRIGALRWRAKLRLVWALLRDGRVPLWLRALIPALVVYLAMPIDIIPDFIPVIGHLDDLLVLLVAVGTLVRFTPRDVLDDLIGRLEAEAAETSGNTDAETRS